MSRSFYNPEMKEDSPAKLAKVAGKPTKYHLFANEYNTVVDLLNVLRNMISISSGQINQIIATGVEVNMGEIADGDVVTAINTADGGISLGVDGTTFITMISDGIRTVFVFYGTPGTYGAGEMQLTGSEIAMIYDASAIPLSGKKEYHATLDMNGAAAPTVAVSVNDFEAATITKTGVGYYRFTSPGINAGGKVSFRAQSPLHQYGINFEAVGTDYIDFIIFNSSTNTVTDSLDYNGFQVEITKRY